MGDQRRGRAVAHARGDFLVNGTRRGGLHVGSAGHFLGEPMQAFQPPSVLLDAQAILAAQTGAFVNCCVGPLEQAT